MSSNATIVKYSELNSYANEVGIPAYSSDHISKK